MNSLSKLMSLKHYHHPATSTGQKIASPKKYLTASKIKYVCRVYMHIFLYIVYDKVYIYTTEDTYITKRERKIRTKDGAQFRYANHKSDSSCCG